jgi:hypothetical protein
METLFFICKCYASDNYSQNVDNSSVFWWAPMPNKTRASRFKALASTVLKQRGVSSQWEQRVQRGQSVEKVDTKSHSYVSICSMLQKKSASSEA